MKNYQKICLACLIAVTTLITSCSSSLKVTSDYDKNASFTAYRTFAIDTLLVTQRVSQLNQNRIINAVKAEMTRKGFMESSSPDMLVHISTILKDEKSVSASTNYTYGGYYRPYAWGAGMGANSYTTYNVQNYTNGSLIIGVADAKTKSLLWEGIGNKDIDGSFSDADTKIPAAVSSIMVSFPPGAISKK